MGDHLRDTGVWPLDFWTHTSVQTYQTTSNGPLSGLDLDMQGPLLSSESIMLEMSVESSIREHFSIPDYKLLKVSGTGFGLNIKPDTGV